MTRILVLLIALGCAAAVERPAQPVSPLLAEDLDAAAFAQWVDGAETPIDAKDGARAVLRIQGAASTSPHGLAFGDSRTPGLRHLRIGWKRPLALGTVLARDGGRVSVLSASAPYPGDLADESQWLPAERISSHAVGREEAGGDDIALWVLPPGTTTRAIRFSHLAGPTDKVFAGRLRAAELLTERLVSLAGQALVTASSSPEHCARIANEVVEGWGAWDNGAEGAEQEVSPAHPETVTLEWSRPVRLRGLCALWAGFSACEVVAYRGAPDGHASEAGAADWQPVTAAAGVQNGYPGELAPAWIDFPAVVTTRALQLRITAATHEGHPHLQGKTKAGHRVWLGELLALSPLGQDGLASAILPAIGAAQAHPPIPVPFTLSQPGYVTLVIDDAAGRRVRNLVAETPFPAGANTAWWDGMDDLGRDPAAAAHGIYHVPGSFVAPGDYQLHGLTHAEIDLPFEFSVHNAGSPAWLTEDGTGGWTTTHTPPRCVQFVPGERAPGGKPLIYIGSYVAEGGHGLAWVDPGGRKVGGRHWVGGNWTGAQHLARDAGAHADSSAWIYVGSGWENEVRLTALTDKGDRHVVTFTVAKKEDSALAGIAVDNGILVCSLPRLKQLSFVDAKAGTILGAAELAGTAGLAFAPDGTLLVIVGKRLLRYTLPPQLTGTVALPPPVVVVAGLDDPVDVCCDSRGGIYISDRGASHQVKVFSPAGAALRAIGHPGAPAAGPYDEQHMNNPAGMTIDGEDRLWVAEDDFQPKRVSLWTLDGRLLEAFYGPAIYGGGGTLDPQDKTRFYFYGMRFALDWAKGTDRVEAVFFRHQEGDQFPPAGHGCGGLPETPHYRDGKRYFSNDHDSNPTGGASVATVWLEREGRAVPVAALGSAQAWTLLKDDAFKACWPAGVDAKGDAGRNQALVAWSDRNGDGRVQSDELTMVKAVPGGVTVMPDLSIIVARVDGRTMRYAPTFANDVPSYDLTAGEQLAHEVQGPASSGGDQALACADGWTVVTLGLKPFAPQSLCGVRLGEVRWSYPDPWPGLHASHEAPVPEQPGEVIGTTRLLGGTVTPKGSDAGPLWAVNGNMGPIYLFTSDGLLVASLFKDVRVGRPWSMPSAQRGMLLNGVSPHDENFWPSLTQTADGLIYLVDGGRTSLVRVDNLDTIRRLPAATLHLGAAELAQAHDYQLQVEQERQQARGSSVLTVALRSQPPVVDGKLEDWKGCQWAAIDRRGTAAWFNSSSKPYDVAGAACVAGGKLYVAFKAHEKDLLRNSGEIANAPFKTGGCLDVMLGAGAPYDDRRSGPVAGDERLLVTRFKERTCALLYRAVVPGTAAPVPFSSPWRTITLDRVDDISDQVEFGADGGDYEIAVPLAVLGLTVAPGAAIRADIGILRGDGMQTLQRVYWSNKGTAITSDVPSEAALTPALWGKWVFTAP